MYDDGYRKYFENIPIAAHIDCINEDTSKYLIDENGNVMFTHPHNHKDFEILLIKSGIADFKIDDITYRVKPNDVILINPYEIHSSLAFRTHFPLSFCCFTFDLSLLGSVSTHPVSKLAQKLCDGSARFDNVVSDCEEISEIFGKLEKIYVGKKGAWEYYVSGYMFEFFGKLCDYGYCHEKVLPSKNKIFIKRIQQYIEKNYSENITSSDAAGELCYDLSYFCRLFRSNFGQKFSEYLNFYRVTQAKFLLKDGYSVSETAALVGYISVSYFVKMFKMYNMVCPSEYKF